MNDAEALTVVKRLTDSSDQHEETRPKIGEVVLAAKVQTVLKARGSAPSERASVAVSLIRERVMSAYKVGAA